MNSTIEKTAEEKNGCATRSDHLSVCFVCTGNTCRSPMAEAVLNDLGRVPEYCSMCPPELFRKRRIRASSAGISAIDGMPISENAANALEEDGIKARPDNDYPAHRAKMVTISDMELNDMIVAISSKHAMALIGTYPQYASKIYTMDEDIPDPFGGDLDDYKACLEKIKGCIARMFFDDEKL